MVRTFGLALLVPLELLLAVANLALDGLDLLREVCGAAFLRKHVAHGPALLRDVLAQPHRILALLLGAG